VESAFPQRRSDSPPTFSPHLSTSHPAYKPQGTVLLNTAAELKSYSKGEEDLLENQIKAIHATGANVIVTGAKVGDMALHYCNRLGIMVVKLSSKFDLRRLCRATSATALPRLTPPTPHELGHCDTVVLEEVGCACRPKKLLLRCISSL
jgi:T-complex protein 1 subunit theta